MTKIHFRPYNPNQTVLFPQRIDEDIAENDPVRMVDALVEGLNLESFRKLYKECGRSPYHPRMMLKVILYAYMNNIYSCRKIEKLLHRDIHYIWLAGYGALIVKSRAQMLISQPASSITGMTGPKCAGIISRSVRWPCVTAAAAI